MRPLRLACATLLLATAAAAGEAEKRSDVDACVARNVPQPDSIRAIKITSEDRTGHKKVTVARVYGRRDPDGMRQLLMRFLKPEDVRGAALLLRERGDETEIYFAPSEHEEPKRVLGSGLSARLFGTDFSYEDLQYLEGFTLGTAWKRLEDDLWGDRPVYVAETRPEESAYERVKTYVDMESCLPLSTWFYDRGRVRKELTVDPSSIRKIGSVWVPHLVMMRDLFDSSFTQIRVDRSQQEPIPAEMFALESFGGAP